MQAATGAERSEEELAGAAVPQAVKRGVRRAREDGSRRGSEPAGRLGWVRAGGR